MKASSASAACSQIKRSRHLSVYLTVPFGLRVAAQGPGASSKFTDSYTSTKGARVAETEDSAHIHLPMAQNGWEACWGGASNLFIMQSKHVNMQDLVQAVQVSPQPWQYSLRTGRSRRILIYAPAQHSSF